MNDNDSRLVELLVGLIEAGCSSKTLESAAADLNPQGKGAKNKALIEAANALKKRNQEDSLELAAQISAPETIAGVVRRRAFEGTALEIARRQADVARQNRPIVVTREMLKVLGGADCDTLPKLLGAAVREVAAAVAKPVLEVTKQTGASVASLQLPENLLTQIVTQSVQQTAFTVQRIITVAIEAGRPDDGTNPKYAYP